MAATRIPDLGRRERRLLLTCGRVELGTEQAEQVGKLVDQPLDWDAIVVHARLHSVAPLLHRHLSRLAEPDRVPREARRRLLALSHRVAYQNAVFSRENALLVDAFLEAGSEVIVPKGISLVEIVYGDLGLRPLIDLMFLVQPRELSVAEARLLERGYTRRPVRPLRALSRWSCPYGWYVHDADIRLAVMLQAGLLSWPRHHRFTPDELWAKARPAYLGGTEVLVLAPVDLVVYLCLQADCTGFFNRAALGAVEPDELLFAEWSHNRLVRFADIHETIRHHRDAIDWDALVARARAAGVEDAVRASLLITERLLGPEVPPTALEGLSAGRCPRIRRTVLRAAAGSRRSAGRELTALAWAMLGPRRQMELFRLIGLVELAFPGLPALRADHAQRSRATLLALAIRHAARVLMRSASEWLQASVPRPAGPGGRGAAWTRIHDDRL